MCVKNAYVLGDVRRRKCREASKVTVLVAAGSAEQPADTNTHTHTHTFQGLENKFYETRRAE